MGVKRSKSTVTANLLACLCYLALGLGFGRYYFQKISAWRPQPLNSRGVLKEHNVLIASVEELERELAQEPLIGLRCRSRDLPKLISVIFATTPAAITTRLAESPDANLL